MEKNDCSGVSTENALRVATSTELLETTVDEVGGCVFSGVRGISLGR